MTEKDWKQLEAEQEPVRVFAGRRGLIRPLGPTKIKEVVFSRVGSDRLHGPRMPRSSVEVECLEDLLLEIWKDRERGVEVIPLDDHSLESMCGPVRHGFLLDSGWHYFGRTWFWHPNGTPWDVHILEVCDLYGCTTKEMEQKILTREGREWIASGKIILHDASYKMPEKLESDPEKDALALEKSILGGLE